MNTNRAAAAFLCTFLAAAAVAQPDWVSKEPENAALVYWQAFDTFPRELNELTTKAAEACTIDPDWVPDAEFAAKLDGISGDIARLLRATRINGCEWGVERTQGFAALLPHLGKLRTASRILLCDARRLGNAGDSAGAEERVAACLRMPAHLRSDRTIISALVAQAIALAATREGVTLVDKGYISSQGAARLHAMTKGLLDNDALGVQQAVESEGDFVVADFTRRIGKPAALAEFYLACGVNPDTDPNVIKLRAMGDDELRGQAAAYRAAYSLGLAAFDSRDEKAIAGVERASGEHGPLAALLMPAFSKVHSSREKARADLEAAMKALAPHTK